MVQANLGKLLVITGATAVGKSAVAVEAAKRLDGEIISADSMQIYRGLDIGTAKISHAEKQGISHHMLDIIAPHEGFSAADFRLKADEIIADIWSRKKTAIVCGGTGLYLNALLYEYDFTAEDKSLTIKYREELSKLDNDALYELLRKSDEKAAQQIHPHNKKRVIRALEMSFFGKRKSDSVCFAEQESRYKHTLIILNMDRERLYRRINDRVDKMLEEGLIEEVCGLLSSGAAADYQSMQAIGYKQMIAFIKGKAEMKETVEKIKQLTRNYAKRQITWFKKMKGGIWLDIDNYDKHSIVEKVINLYENN